MQKDPERFKIDKKSIKELKQKIEEREKSKKIFLLIKEDYS